MELKNYGVSFGKEFPGIIVVSGLLWLLIVYLAIREKTIPLWLVVLGGGLNFGERFIRGYVTDYWKIPGLPLYNNINDWLIFLGIGWYLWQKLIEKK